MDNVKIIERDFTNIQPANEAIAFQNVSGPNLANELTKLFQATIDYRNSVVSSELDRVSSVERFFLHKIAPHVLDAIYKYTGLSMKMVVPEYMACNYAVLMQFEKLEYSVDMCIAAYSGILTDTSKSEYKQELSYRIKTQKELEELAASISRKTGKVSERMLYRHNFKCTLYFDLYGSFLIKELGGPACEPLTAPELSAVIMHEIGHTLSFVEHCADVVLKKEVIKQVTSQFLQTADPKEKVKYVVSALKNVYPSKADTLDKINDYVAPKNPYSGSLIESFSNILFNSISTIIEALGWDLIVLVTSFIKNITDSLYELKRKNKVSDYAYLPQNDQYCELLADQYVARFGYAQHLASALIKLTDWTRMVNMGTTAWQSSSASFYGNLLPWAICAALNITRNIGIEEYPADEKRYEYLLIETLKAFKSSDIDDTLLKEYYNTYIQLKHIVDNPSKTRRWEAKWRVVHQAIEYTLNTPARILFTGNFEKEYALLFDQLQKIANNEIYATAYKLRN